MNQQNDVFRINTNDDYGNATTGNRSLITTDGIMRRSNTSSVSREIGRRTHYILLYSTHEIRFRHPRGQIKRREVDAVERARGLERRHCHVQTAYAPSPGPRHFA